MTIHQFCRLALALALALLAPRLLAGEIVLFDGENFQGASMAFRATVLDLDPTGFNARAASISVRDGTWEGCFDAYFQGQAKERQGKGPAKEPQQDQEQRGGKGQ